MIKAVSNIVLMYAGDSK